MSVFATATGVGSWPGTSSRRAAEVIVGELHRLPYLAELPARGVGADMIGRAGALLVDIAVDTVVRGYRIAARPGAVARRAASLLAEDLAPKIRVNAIAVGSTATSALETVLTNDKVHQAMIEATPLKRLGEPEDMALGALYLASPASAYVTGTVMEIHGGITTANLDLGLMGL